MLLCPLLYLLFLLCEIVLTFPYLVVWWRLTIWWAVSFEGRLDPQPMDIGERSGMLCLLLVGWDSLLFVVLTFVGTWCHRFNTFSHVIVPSSVDMWFQKCESTTCCKVRGLSDTSTAPASSGVWVLLTSWIRARKKQTNACSIQEFREGSG